MRKVFDAFGGQPAAGQVFAGQGAFGRAQLLFKPGGGGFVQFKSLARRRASAASSGEENSRLGSGMPHLLATIRTASGKLPSQSLPQS